MYIRDSISDLSYFRQNVKSLMMIARSSLQTYSGKISVEMESSATRMYKLVRFFSAVNTVGMPSVFITGLLAVNLPIPGELVRCFVRSLAVS